MATAETRRFIRLPKVQEVTSLSRTEIYRRMKSGNFPDSVKLAPGHTVWVESEVLSWMEARIAEARGEAA
ncbi:helix-turn-helix transcriptional regulator [Pseudomonas oryzihabitans]|uniref:helix-turn-helix transcriptional regulator n=1 Tax=Pseudomonas oryzihabitans TaxID=47885 RepID=UPI002898DB8F|nr:AlpA family phage regulatory protein [Pseudomonas oryzihabitans]